ncbi:MAG: TadE family protein [Planctomycetota bacterium]
MVRHQRFLRRDGGTLVELAVVISIFFLFLFGILEYARLVFVRQVIVNAAREGARYAVVNVVDSTVVSDTTAYVKTRMAGLDTKTTYYNCQVYLSDSTGKNIGAAGDAAFGQYIAVQIDYDYTPITPNFLFLNNTIRITARDLMYSEAN